MSDVVYSSGTAHYRIRVAPDMEINQKIQAGSMARQFDIGETVHLSWDESDSQLIARNSARNGRPQVRRRAAGVSKEEFAMIFDYVIVGGGSAGCVLANRLSADPSKQVALLEAGPDTPPEHISTEIYALSFLPHYFGEECYWTKLEAYVDPIGNHSVEEMMRSQKPRRYEQARIMGGGSTVNGQVAIRGLPSDYDEWDSLGARGWRWDDCLPYFRRLERDMDFDGPLHGKEGPIPIHRTFPPDWGAFSLAFRDSLAKKGIPYYDDCHGQFGDGCFPFPRNNILTHRVSTAMGYLDGATRLRKNLHILAKTALAADRVRRQAGGGRPGPSRGAEGKDRGPGDSSSPPARCIRRAS